MSADIGRARRTGGGISGALVAVLVALVIVAVAGYFVLAGDRGGEYMPYTPNATNAPATSAPTSAPSRAPGGYP